MTNQEIDKKVAALWAIAISMPNPDNALEVMKALLREDISQAYEEAIKAICVACARGEMPVRPDGESHHPYEHRSCIDGYGAVSACDAYPIHDLRDSLEKVAV